jgi:hypothetical protein
MVNRWVVRGVGVAMGGVGLYLVDRIVFTNLDYFGKYITFGLFNLFWILFPLFGDRIGGERWGKWMPLLIGAVELGFGVVWGGVKW